MGELLREDRRVRSLRRRARSCAYVGQFLKVGCSEALRTCQHTHAMNDSPWTQECGITSANALRAARARMRYLTGGVTRSLNLTVQRPRFPDLLPRFTHIVPVPPVHNLYHGRITCKHTREQVGAGRMGCIGLQVRAFSIGARSDGDRLVSVHPHCPYHTHCALRTQSLLPAR